MAERWKPNNGEEYFFVDSLYGGVQRDIYLNCRFDKKRWENGNCFKIKKEAEYAAIKVKDLLLSLHYGSAIDIGTKNALVEADGAMKLGRALLELFENNKESQADLQDKTTNIQDKTTNIQDKPLPKLTAEVFARPDCPDWAKFAAVDKYRNAMWYEGEPKVVGSVFWNSQRGQIQEIPGKFDASDWQNSLVERPDAKLPDWCKIGAWVYVPETHAYHKITFMDESQVNTISYDVDCCTRWNYQVVIEETKQARLRPYKAEEMKALVGKIVCDTDGNNELITGWSVDMEKVRFNSIYYSAPRLLDEKFTIDGKPCGCLEHLENGEWVK